jgi:dipeptidyl aminopeptidase/acylaminoacyl peptidase
VRTCTLLFACLLLAPVSAAPQAGGTAVDPVDLFRIRAITNVRLSPDGRQVAFAVTGLPPDGSLNARRGRIYVGFTNGGPERPVTSADHWARAPEWSPDGSQLAYVSNDSGRNDLWVIPAAGGTPQRLTKASTGVSAYAWAPDGRRIAFVMTDPSDSALTVRRRLVQLADDPGPVARLWIVSLDAPADVRPLTDAPWNVLGVPAWSPDGKFLAFRYAPEASLAATLQTSVATLDVDTRRATTLRFTGLAFDRPLYSPDGKWVAMRAQVRPSRGLERSAFYVVSTDGQRSRDLGEADGRSRIDGWLPDGSGVIMTRHTGTIHRVERRSLDGRTEELYAGPLVASELSMSGDRTSAAFVGESLETPAEVYVASLASFQPGAISRVNAEVKLAPFGRTELLRWKSNDGVSVEGLLTYPAGYVTGTKVPLLVVAHAGGETFYASYAGSPYEPGSTGYGSRGAWPVPVFTSRGYAMLRVNQRGGGLGGYGFEASTPLVRPKERANPDILAGVDLVIRMGVADPDRLAIMGWSNGALVANSLITTTDRFAAASVMADFPDLVLVAGVNPYMVFDLGAEPWENIAPYLAHAPSFALDKVKAATLILHGEVDDAVPVAQASALYGSLKKLGVPVQLAIYPGMGHGPATPSQVADIAMRNLEWFNRWLKNRDRPAR